MSKDPIPQSSIQTNGTDAPAVDAAQQALAAAKEAAAAARTAADEARSAAEAAGKADKQATEHQRLAGAALTDAQTKLAEVSAIATQAIAANTKITDHQAVVATKSDHIQKAQEHADKVRGDLDRALTAAAQQVVAAEAECAKAKLSAARAAEELEAIESAKADADTATKAAIKAQTDAETATTVAKGLAEKATTVEKRIAEYEARLTEIDQRCAEQLATINELLRGATSAGLATAFDKRRQTFIKPNSRWQWVFVGSVLSLVVLTISGLVHVYHLEKVPEWGELARLWVTRFPIAGALIWLALHASREAALAKRLEEDYGYKASIAACFEGFRKQMSDIDTGDSPNSQLARLCENTLATIASPPGRIYAAHKLTVSPTEELATAAKAAAEVASTMKPS